MDMGKIGTIYFGLLITYAVFAYYRNRSGGSMDTSELKTRADKSGIILVMFMGLVIGGFFLAAVYFLIVANPFL